MTIQARAEGVEADPCGENGEFHSFAWEGPIFLRPIGIQMGEVVTGDGFEYVDMLPTEGEP